MEICDERVVTALLGLGRQPRVNSQDSGGRNPIRRFGGSGGGRFKSSISSARMLITEACRFCEASSFSTRGETLVAREKLAHLDESANDEDAHLDGAPALEDG